MTNGSRCSLRAMVLSVVALLVIVGSLIWWLRQPQTPRDYFEARCSSCHELRTEKVCEFPSMIRPQIVDVMRREHGADEVISEQEARIIKNFLAEELQCR